MHNNQLDKFIETLIEEMSTKQLWKVVFNKMTNAAKRQMLGEMLNTLMGSGYSTNGNMFDYNPKEIMKTSGEAIDEASKPFTDEGYVDFTQKIIYKPQNNIDENMYKENEENLSKANEVINKANKLLAPLEEIKELNTKALIENKIETLSTMQSIVLECIKEVEGQYYSKAVEEVFYSIVEQLGKAIKEEQNKLEGNNDETITEKD